MAGLHSRHSSGLHTHRLITGMYVIYRYNNPAHITCAYRFTTAHEDRVVVVKKKKKNIIPKTMVTKTDEMCYVIFHVILMTTATAAVKSSVTATPVIDYLTTLPTITTAVVKFQLLHLTLIIN